MAAPTLAQGTPKDRSPDEEPLTWSQFIPYLVPFTDTVVEEPKKLRLNAQFHIDRLWEIVRTCRTPHHILVAGPWGHGKSTVVEGVRKQAQATRLVDVVGINAWKYSRESLQRKLMLEVTGQISPATKQALKARMYKNLSGVRAYPTFDWKAQWPRLVRFVTTFVVVMAVVAGIAAFQTWLDTGVIMGHGTLWRANISKLLTAQLLAFIGSFTVAELAALYARKDGHLELTHAEQYEELFSDALEQYHRRRLRWSRLRKRLEWRKADEQRKLLVVIDDLDRCSSKQILEAIETVKTFMNAPGCIFLVACDRQRLEKAMSEETGTATNGYVDKVFETIYPLGDHSRENLTDYAEGLLQHDLIQVLPASAPKAVRDALADFAKYVKGSGAIDVLIQEAVTTPRQVKRALNEFLVICRSYFTLKAEVALESHSADWCNIARLAVISMRFPQYSDLFRNTPELLRGLMVVGETSFRTLPPRVRNLCALFFELDDRGRVNWNKSKTEAKELLGFIHDQEGEGTVHTQPDLKHTLMELARSGDWDEVAEETGAHPALREQLRAWIVGDLRNPAVADEVVQANLLLVLLHLEPPQAAVHSALAAVHKRRDTIRKRPEFWQPTVLPRLLRWIERMGYAQRLEWQRFLAERAYSRPADLCPSLLKPGVLPLLAGFVIDPRRAVGATLLAWIATPNGQEHWDAFMAQVNGSGSGGVAPAKDVIDFLQRAAVDLGGSNPAPKLLQPMMELFGRALAEQDEVAFWGLVVTLVRRGMELPETGVNDWLPPLLSNLVDVMPRAVREQLVVELSLGSGPAEQLAESLLKTLLSTPGDGSPVDRSGTLMEHWMRAAVGPLLAPRADLVLHHWTRWSPNARQIFLGVLLRVAQNSKAPKEFHETFACLSQVPPDDLSAEFREAYFQALMDRLQVNWKDSAWVEALCLPLTRSTLNGITVPPALLLDLLERMRGIAFGTGHASKRTKVLQEVIGFVRAAAPAAQRSIWMDAITKKYLQADDPARVDLGAEALFQLAAGATDLTWSTSEAIKHMVVMVTRNPKVDEQLRGALHRLIAALAGAVDQRTAGAIHSFLIAEVTRAPLDQVATTMTAARRFVDLAPVMAAAVQKHAGNGEAMDLLARWMVERAPDEGPNSLHSLTIRLLRSAPGQRLLLQAAKLNRDAAAEIVATVLTVATESPLALVEGMPVLRALSGHMTRGQRKTLAFWVARMANDYPGQLRTVINSLPELLTHNKQKRSCSQLRTVFGRILHLPNEQVGPAVLALMEQHGPLRPDRVGGWNRPIRFKAVYLSDSDWQPQ